MDVNFLDELLLHISSLASIYHKSPTTFINHYKPRFLLPSPALQKSTQRPSYITPAPTLPPTTPSTQKPIATATATTNDLGYSSMAANRLSFNGNSFQSVNPYATDVSIQQPIRTPQQATTGDLLLDL
jgi:hypothetical protein